jgi:hypothetical protein
MLRPPRKYTPATNSAMPRTCVGVRYWASIGKKEMVVVTMPASNNDVVTNKIKDSGKKCKIHMLVFTY